MVNHTRSDIGANKGFWKEVRDYEIANRILRKNGKMILFSQEPYTTKLITEAMKQEPYIHNLYLTIIIHHSHIIRESHIVS